MGTVCLEGHETWKLKESLGKVPGFLPCGAGQGLS